MEFNSIELARRNNIIPIDLFSGCGGLQKLSKTIKRATYRVAEEKCNSLWQMNECLKKISELYLPVWEEELTDLVSGEKHTVMANLEDLPRLGKAEMTQKIVRYFRGLGYPVRRDFIGRVEVWIPKEEEYYTTYERYTLQPRHHDIVEGWQIDISHSGESRASKKTLYDVELSDKGFDVVAGTEILNRRDVKQRHFQKFGGGHPVINKYTSKILHIEKPGNYDRDKYKTKMDKIKGFIHKYLFTPDFQDALDINILNGGNLIKVRPEEIYMVDAKARNLKYGEGHVGRTPKSEFAQYGPFHNPQPYKYFFICPKGCEMVRNRLFNILQNGVDSSKLKDTDKEEHGSSHNFRRLSELLCQQLHWVRNLSLTYTSHDSAMEELERHLKDESRFAPDSKYIALIISDIHRDSPDSQLHELYYRMKELLMKYGVTSQVIYARNIGKDNFNFFLPNIAAAITAKESGMPWALESLTQRNDMIVGIGASKQHGLKPYLGTAFCFDKIGQFREFDCCQAEDTEALGTSLKKALWQFCNEYGKPERLIIHYYKKLRHDEGEQIEDILLQNDIQCPVYVVNIVTAENEDLIAFDPSQWNLMPKSGTFVHLRDTQFLLYNNEKYNDNGKAKVLFPIKLSIASTHTNTGGILTKEDYVDIITQVYQFCRLYWKSVSMQNVPITIAYPELVAQFVPHFRDGELPDFGKHNLWML